MLNLHFCVHFLILGACCNFFDSNGLEWLQFKTPQQLQARSHLKPLVALEPWHQPWRLHVHFPSLLSVLIVIERLYPLHGLQLCHSTLKTGYLTIKSFSTNLVPVALRCPILWLSISWLQVICDPNGTCWTPAYNFNYMSVVFCYCYCLYIYMIDRLQHRKLLPKGVIQHVPKARLRLRIFHRTFTAKAYALC